jgi:hypothetical protein
MKNLPLSFLVFFVLVAHISFGSSCSEIADSRKDSLMEFCKKELFNLGFQWSYNMPSNGIKTSFSDISDAEIYNDEYLNEMLDSIQTDSLNPLFWNNIGTYLSEQ